MDIEIHGKAGGVLKIDVKGFASFDWPDLFITDVDHYRMLVENQQQPDLYLAAQLEAGSQRNGFPRGVPWNRVDPARTRWIDLPKRNLSHENIVVPLAEWIPIWDLTRWMDQELS